MWRLLRPARLLLESPRQLPVEAPLLQLPPLFPGLRGLPFRFRSSVPEPSARPTWKPTGWPSESHFPMDWTKRKTTNPCHPSSRPLASLRCLFSLCGHQQPLSPSASRVLRLRPEATQARQAASRFPLQTACLEPAVQLLGPVGQGHEEGSVFPGRDSLPLARQFPRAPVPVFRPPAPIPCFATCRPQSVQIRPRANRWHCLWTSSS